jgi:hypothetical protein
MGQDDLLIRLRKVFDPQGKAQSNFGPDERIAPALGILVEAVLKLDETSTELATANMKLTAANVKLTKTYTWLTVAILVVGLIQIVLMLRGH